MRAILLTLEILKNQLIDAIIKEPLGGAHHNPEKVYQNLLIEIQNHMDELLKINSETRIKKRIEKFMKMGVYNN